MIRVPCGSVCWRRKGRAERAPSVFRGAVSFAARYVAGLSNRHSEHNGPRQAGRRGPSSSMHGINPAVSAYFQPSAISPGSSPAQPHESASILASPAAQAPHPRPPPSSGKPLRSTSGNVASDMTQHPRPCDERSRPAFLSYRVVPERRDRSVSTTVDFVRTTHLRRERPLRVLTFRISTYPRWASWCPFQRSPPGGSLRPALGCSLVLVGSLALPCDRDGFGGIPCRLRYFGHPVALIAARAAFAVAPGGAGAGGERPDRRPSLGGFARSRRGRGGEDLA